ncbi:MarR family transcriptional regulator [Streptomyces sp. NPDC059009]|uniref:GbsR/MarR family transcriptional regulator n=1 Tax=Streptomyces sp. NPDC059009 TaxID=3346694 RepID=UPI0036995312
MPGSRLTQEDRHRIAGWLAQGTGYAEIARRLGRPTSTVSREVARNGGPERYRADHAQYATGRRARWPRTATATTAATTSADDADGRDPDQVRAFTEEFAALMVQTGVPRMAARVLSSLFTADSGSLTSAELVQRLRVSPASVSKAIGYLEALALVRREREPRHRRETYRLDDDVWQKAWTTSAHSTERWADAARRGARLLDTSTPAGARLDDMGLFFTRLSDDMDSGPTDVAAGDSALTVLAALVHAGAPRTPEQLAAALGWPADRVTAALDTAAAHPDLADPLALHRAPSGAYAVAARAARLTDRQRAALSAAG